MRDGVVITSRVTLTRNYPDLPFDAARNAETAGRVVSRTAGALPEGAFTLHLLREMSPDNRAALQESGSMPGYPDGAAQTAAVLLPMEGGASALAGGAEHVTLVSVRPGMALLDAAEDCFRVEDQLSRRVSFAFDDQLGYLQADSRRTGTGLTACVRLHLPMLARARRIPELASTLAAEGLSLTPADLPEGKPVIELLEISNRSALGRTEQEICQQVARAAQRVAEMEEEMRRQAMQEQPLRLTDRLWRALGLMRSARLVTLQEFWRLWSDVRLGAALGVLPLAAEQLDQLIPEVQPAHLRNYAEEALEGDALNECRASRVRELLDENPLA